MLRFYPLLFLLFQPIDMADCQCPQINYIDSEGISRLEYGAYLSGRRTQSPNVTVKDSCQLEVDCTDMRSDNFYFMVFRDGAPPIFNRRFLPSDDQTTRFSPTDISCVLHNGSYEWQFNGAKIDNMTFALQDATCNGCQNFWQNDASVTQVDGQCDMVQVTCNDPNALVYYSSLEESYDFLLSTVSPVVMTEVTCVGYLWYLNHFPLYEAAFTCRGYINPLDYQPANYTPTPCGCPPILDVFSNPEYLRLYDKSNILKPAYRAVSGQLSIPSDDSDCSEVSIQCPADSKLTILGRNLKPRMYSPDQPPVIQCKRSPLGENDNLDSVKYWIIDGNIMTDAGFACFVPRVSCGCPFEYMDESNIESLVGTNPFYPNIAGKRMTSASDNFVPDDVCPDKVSCPAGYTVVVFGKENGVVFNTSATIPTTCNPSTGLWTVGALSSSQFDSLSVICVNMRMNNCQKKRSTRF